MKKLKTLIYSYKYTLLVSIISFMLVCCSSTKSATVSLAPSSTDVTIAQAHWQGTTLDDLSKGYDLYSNKCTQCHGLKKPQDFSDDDWTNNYMPDMGKRARLNTTDYQLVLHYILAKREEITSAKK